jgi:hypothetical protein
VEMKAPAARKSVYFPVLLLAVIFFLPAGCQSNAALARTLRPFKFLGIHDVYFYVPVRAHEELAGQFMARFFGLPPQNQGQILSHIDAVYGGFGPDPAALELALTGSFPRMMLKSALTAKNGWAPGQDTDTFRHSAMGLEIHAGEPGVIFVANDTRAMLARSEIDREDAPLWMTGDVSGPDILFYMPRAMRFAPVSLQVILGSLSALREASLSGTLTKFPGDSGYIAFLDINIHNERLASAAAPLLAAGIGGFITADVTVGQGGHILLSGIPLEPEAILEFLR